MVAYILMAMMAVAIAIMVGWRIYFGRERSMRRRHAQDRAAYEATMTARADRP